MNFTKILILLASTALCLGQVFPERDEVYKQIDDFFQVFRDQMALETDDVRDAAETTVTIKNGTLQGTTRTIVDRESNADPKIQYAYRHIPFAAPPVGKLRFQPPEPFLEGFGNVTYNAQRHSPACAQHLTHIQPSSEDCLYLNIYTNRPANSPDKTLRPVMVFLHGGAFILGETSVYTGRRLVVEDIILVVPAYRLSVFGFFSTGDSVVPGNMALKDVVQALRWIQENIEAFGGDPNQVTLSGESAGANLASYVHISPLAKGLFKRVFLMSGVSNSEWGIDRNPRLSADLLAKSLNCPTDSTTAMVDCLREVPEAQMAKQAVENLIDRVISTFRIELPGVVAVIEPEGPGAFLTEDPIKILQEGDIPDVPVMMGSVQHEGVLIMGIAIYIVGQPWGLIYDKHWLQHDMISQLMSVYGVDDSKNGGTLSRSVALSFFPNNKRTNFTEMSDEMIDMLSVAFMKAPILRKAEILTERKRDVYIYSFEHYGSNSLWNFIRILIDLVFLGKAVHFKTGIMHGDDMQYMFWTPVIFSPADKIVSRTYIRLAANFVTHGNPTPAENLAPNLPIWPKFDFDNRNYLKINATPHVMIDYASSWRQGIPN